MKLVIFGPQGSGKGTYASRLSPKLGIPHISTGDIFREETKNQTPLGKKVESYMSKGLLVPDEITIQILEERLNKPDCANGFILDGFPRTLNQAKELEKITGIDAVIALSVPEHILLERLASRVSCENCQAIYNLKTLKPKKEGVCDKCEGKLIQRADETPEAIKQRLSQYKTMSEPLIGYYKQKTVVLDIKVDKSDVPPEIVVNEIIGKLSDFRKDKTN
jgi:adenylate kinase